jgi:putative ABC transport system permease protein
VIWGRLVDMFRRRRLDADLASQLAHHLDGLEAEARAQGQSADDARAAARRAMGGLTQVRDAYRDQLTIPVIDALWADIRYAVRAIRHNPTFTVVVVVTLALGIGANTAVFSVLDSVVLKPLSYPRPEELVALRLIAPGATGSTSSSDGLNLSPSMYFTYAENNRVFDSLGVWIATNGTVTGVADPEPVRAIGVSDGVLQALNVPPAAGRWLLAEDQLGPPRPPPSLLRAYSKVMLSYGYWQRRFAGDPSVVGRTIIVDARPKEIVGVTPRGFRIVNTDADLYFPIAFDRGRIALTAGGTGGGFGYQSIARLRPGVTIAQANADVARMVPIWMNAWTGGPGTSPREYETWRIAPALRPLKEEVVGGVTDVLWVVMATIGLVMLIACANVANLLLVRAEVRQRELAVRAALGAGRGRIIRSLLVESMLLGLMGGVLGVGLAYAGVRLLLAIGPANLPRLSEIALDSRTFAFTALLSLLSSALFGLIPALKYTGPGIAAALGSFGRSASVSRERHRVRGVLVVVQVAIAFVLLVSAGLMIRTFESLRTVEPGFTEPEHLQVLRMFVAASISADAAGVTRLQNDLQDKLSSIPGVTSAAFGSAMPMEGYGPNLGVVNFGAIRTDDRRDSGSDTPPVRLFKYVSPGFFRTAGTRLVAGRDITWTEVYGLRPLVLISENLARELWGTPAAAVGRRVRQDESMPWHEVIGVVQDVREDGLYRPAPRIVYWASMSGYIGFGSGTNAIRGVTFVVRTERPGTEGFLNQLRQAVWSVNSSLPVSPRTMREVYDQSLAPTSFTLVMLAIAASMALLLGIVGIYGVISYTVTQRRREIGIRAALGAQQRELKGMFVRHALALAGIGVVIGLGVAAGLTRLMSTLLYGITPLDPVTYVAVPLVLVTATVLASYLPARRAATVDPVEALRVE